MPYRTLRQYHLKSYYGNVVALTNTIRVTIRVLATKLLLKRQLAVRQLTRVNRFGWWIAHIKSMQTQTTKTRDNRTPWDLRRCKVGRLIELLFILPQFWELRCEALNTGNLTSVLFTGVVLLILTPLLIRVSCSDIELIQKFRNGILLCATAKTRRVDQSARGCDEVERRV